MHQRGGARHPPSQATTVRPTSLPLSPISLCVRALAPWEHPLTLLLRATQQPGSPAPRTMGRDTIVPPHYRYSRSTAPRTRQQAHTRGANTQASKQAGARGRRDHTAPTTPKRAHTSKHANTHTNTGSSSKHQTQPPTKQTRPQQVPPHPREHKSAHAETRGQAKQCERKTMGQHPGMKQSRRNPQRRARRSKHTRSAQTTWFAPVCACARHTGVRRERKAAHNSPRQSAWVDCVCGRVCGRLSAFLGWWVLGVWVFFGGVWRVFLFFDIFGL